MQSYSATITCSRMTSLVHHGFLTPKGFKFHSKICIKSYFGINVEFTGLKIKTHFLQDVFFIDCDIFPHVICLQLIKHVFCK